MTLKSTLPDFSVNSHLGVNTNIGVKMLLCDWSAMSVMVS